MSDPDDCTCEHMCPGAVACACVYNYETGECHGYCENKVPKEKTLKAALDSRVDVNLRDASLGLAGRMISDLADADVYVPAGRIDETRSLYLKDVTLDAAIRELGLLALIRPSSPEAF